MSEHLDDQRARQQGRVVLGFLLAPLIASALAASAMAVLLAGTPPTLDRIVVAWAVVFVGALVYAYPTALMLGGPFYVLLHRRLRPRLIYCLLVGGSIAVVPVLAVAIALARSRVTPADVFSLAGTFGSLFGLGSVGGLVFWLCAFRGAAQPASQGARGSRASISS
jgi:hypothetical protein